MQHDRNYSNFVAHKCMQKLNRLLGHQTDVLCFDGAESYFIDMKQYTTLDVPKNTLNLPMVGIWGSENDNAIDFTGVKSDLNFSWLIDSAKYLRALFGSTYDEIAASVLSTNCLCDKRIELVADDDGAICATEFHDIEKIREFKFNTIDEIANFLFGMLEADYEKIFEIAARLKKELKIDELRKEGRRL